jgi:hypothetical protein
MMGDVRPIHNSSRFNATAAIKAMLYPEKYLGSFRRIHPPGNRQGVGRPVLMSKAADRKAYGASTKQLSMTIRDVGCEIRDISTK